MIIARIKQCFIMFIEAVEYDMFISIIKNK